MAYITAKQGGWRVHDMSGECRRVEGGECRPITQERPITQTRLITQGETLLYANFVIYTSCTSYSVYLLSMVWAPLWIKIRARMNSFFAVPYFRDPLDHVHTSLLPRWRRRAQQVHRAEPSGGATRDHPLYWNSKSSHVTFVLFAKYSVNCNCWISHVALVLFY